MLRFGIDLTEGNRSFVHHRNRKKIGSGSVRVTRMDAGRPSAWCGSEISQSNHFDPDGSRRRDSPTVPRNVDAKGSAWRAARAVRPRSCFRPQRRGVDEADPASCSTPLRACSTPSERRDVIPPRLCSDLFQIGVCSEG